MLAINPKSPTSGTQLKNLQAAAEVLGLQLVVLQASVEEEFDALFIATREADFVTAGDALAPAFLPTSFIGASSPRIQAYRRLNEVGTPEALDQLRKTWRDRFGKFPPPVENLLKITEIKLAAAARKISVVEVREDRVMLTRNNEYIQIGGKFPRVSAADPTARLSEVLALVRAF